MKYLILITLISFSNVSFAGKVKYFTAENPSKCIVRDWVMKPGGPFGIPDVEATTRQALNCCKQYSVDQAYEKAVRKCSEAVGDLDACQGAQYTSQVLSFNTYGFTADCNIEVSVILQKSQWR